MVTIDDELEGDAFSETDLRRLDRAIRDARRASTTPVSSLIGPIAGGEAGRLTEDHCVFDHCAVLLFPRTLESGLCRLERQGLSPLPPVPSTVVRRRLSLRYAIDLEECEVHITRLHLDLPNGRRHPAAEVFLFPRTCGALTEYIEKSEATHGFENHTAFVVKHADQPLLENLVGAWRHEAGMLWEGGGHNPHEGGRQGSTVMYFVRASMRTSGGRRFELHCAGDLTSFFTGIPMETEGIRDAYAAWRRGV